VTAWPAACVVIRSASTWESWQAYYNYAVWPNTTSDEQGICVFRKNESGEVFHTYSCHGRGIDMINGAYQFLDLVPKAAMRAASAPR
jgi:predicted dithiol-disulfide oxidoreductase (DUF899 family)